MALRRLLGLGGAAALLLAIAVGGPILGAHLVRSRGIPRVEERLGRRVRVQEVRVRWGRLDLAGLSIDGQGRPEPLFVPRLTVRFAMLPLLAGRVAIDEVTLERPRINVVRPEAGEDNVTALVDRLRGGERGAAGQGGPGVVSGPRRLRLVGAQITVDDALLGTLEVRAADATLDRGGEAEAHASDLLLRLAAGPQLAAARIDATFALDGWRPRALPAVTVTGGACTVWRGFTLTGIQGRVAPDPAATTEVQIALEGGYGGVERVLWSASGAYHPATRKGQLDLVAKRFDLGQLRPILAGTPIIDPQQAEVDARLGLLFVGDPEPGHLHDAIDFDGRFELAGLSVYHPMLGPHPVRHLGFEATAKGRLEPRARTIHLAEATIDYRDLKATLTLDAQKLGKKPAFAARLVLPPVPCQAVLLALPAELTPALQGFRLSGTFQTNLHAAIDLSDLDQGVDLGGEVGIDGCRVVNATAATTQERLLGSFDHAAEVVPGEWVGVTAGPESPEFVPYADLSPHLINSIMTTEDSTFFRHRGFIPSEFRSALKSNLEHGYFRLGASSITMQMVKNVFLSREKTLSRKLQELFLSWYVERILSKERILEIYFNVIEFGPRLYGIGPAVRHYFGKAVKDLTPREAVWFSSILPSPKRRYVHFCKGAPDAKWEAYLNRILKRMHERGRLTDAEYEAALGQKLVFDRREAAPERECLDVIKRLTTPQTPAAAIVARPAPGEDGEP